MKNCDASEFAKNARRRMDRAVFIALFSAAVSLGAMIARLMEM